MTYRTSANFSRHGTVVWDTERGWHDRPAVGQSATEWAREHGEHYSAAFLLDNHEPPRNWLTLPAYAYTSHDGTSAFVIDGARALRDYNQAIYLMDDGTTVRPFYVAAWHPADDGQTHVIVHAFPVNVNDDGTPHLRPDGRPVSFDSWQLGPRRAYHVKIRPSLATLLARYDTADDPGRYDPTDLTYGTP
jgi:hypothetical protein